MTNVEWLKREEANSRAPGEGTCLIFRLKFCVACAPPRIRFIVEDADLCSFRFE